MAKKGGNKVTIVRTEPNSLRFSNGLAEPFRESFQNCKSMYTSKLLAGLLQEWGGMLSIDGRVKVKLLVNKTFENKV